MSGGGGYRNKILLLGSKIFFVDEHLPLENSWLCPAGTKKNFISHISNPER
jgi:hypothetical protein